MFVAEQNYSGIFEQMYLNLGELMIEEGQQRNLPFPAAHSPGVNHIKLSLPLSYVDADGLMVTLFQVPLNIASFRHNLPLIKV